MPKSKKRKDAKGKPVRRKNIPRFQPDIPKVDKQSSDDSYLDRSFFDSDDHYFVYLDLMEGANAAAERNALADEIESRRPPLRLSKEEEDLPFSLWRVQTDDDDHVWDFQDLGFDDDDPFWDFDGIGTEGTFTLARTEKEAIAIVLGRNISTIVAVLRGCNASSDDVSPPPKASECHAIMLAGPGKAPGHLSDWITVFYSIRTIIDEGRENDEVRMETRRLLAPFTSGFEREIPSVRDEVRTEIERLIKLGNGVWPLIASTARSIFFIEPEVEKLSSEISCHQEDVRTRKRI